MTRTSNASSNEQASGRWHYERPILLSKIVGFHALDFRRKPFAWEPGCISIDVTTALSSKRKARS
jgi:hypothetical protein